MTPQEVFNIFERYALAIIEFRKTNTETPEYVQAKTAFDQFETDPKIDRLLDAVEYAHHTKDPVALAKVRAEFDVTFI